MRIVLLVLALFIAGCWPSSSASGENKELTGEVHASWDYFGTRITEFTPATAPDMLCVMVSYHGVYCFPKGAARK